MNNQLTTTLQVDWNLLFGSMIMFVFIVGMIKMVSRELLTEHHSTTKKLGTCYEDAWRFLIKEEEGELIHGSIESEGKRIKHAWVELPTGFIYEPETGKFMRIQVFNSALKPQEEARYTVTEAAIIAARTSNLGPWSEEERGMLTEHHSNPRQAKLPPRLTIPPKDLREQALADIRRSQPRQALEALSDYYSVTVPSFVTMEELYTISPCLYGAAEDAWGSGAEAMYMPQRLQRIACLIRTNEDFIVVSPEVDLAEYPMHVIEEFYHHLFNCRPGYLKGYPRDEEYACMMVCRAWRVN